MNIVVLTYIEAPDQKPDGVVEQVARALRNGGHEVSIIAEHGDVARLVSALSRARPDLVFNLMEMFGDNVLGDVSVVGLLDMLGLRYTGSGPAELSLAQDKGLSKKILAFEGILYPRFAVFSKDADFETGGNLHMPLFVKPLRMDASIGIDRNGLVHDARALMKRVLAIHEECDDSALAEEFIEGRELYVGILGNAQPTALPPIEIDFTGFPEGRPHILDQKAKFDEQSAEYKGTKAVVAELPDELRARLQKVSLDAYRALRVRDYGRVDLRLTEAGDIYVIEVNASCYLEASGEFAMAAAAAGIGYDALVQRIVDLAMQRYAR
ncbi:D-alanine--D-alanine ligase family protein [Sorangium sp. So ce861]|uniref:D-alanine--D-alanine ligase family protein n=1 Tax=Sorangium sp. So ce861 TaxID=3133323 RepID=UPI003F6426AF